jgi:hypothetical protein
MELEPFPVNILIDTAMVDGVVVPVVDVPSTLRIEFDVPVANTP